MSIPKEPRQIMINLMYLVLTALLALNVSNEILHAFNVLSKGIADSNESIDQKTKAIYADMKANEVAAGQAEKVRPFRERADQVVKRSDELMAYLEAWKERIVTQAGGRNKEDSSIKAEGDIDATTSLLVEKKGGDTIKNKIVELRKFLLEQLQPKDSTAISPLMPLRITPERKNDHNPTGDWSIGLFEHMPTVAAIAMFAKFQNDVRSSEAQVIKTLFEEAHLKDIKFDTIGAVAVPKQSYVLAGDKVEASILLAAFNKNQKPTVTGLSGGGSTKPAVMGVVPWETIASGTGLQTIQGNIQLVTENGVETRKWKFDYMVGTTGASMQLDKMNVFYIGVPNPVTVAAAGYSVEDVSLSIPGAVVTGEKGHYIITVDKINNALDVAINAKTKEGTVKKVGGMTIRVKRIPNPVASLNKISSGSMSAALFRVQIAPAAVLDNFDFDARFTIIGFSMAMLPKGKDYQGPYTAANRGGCRFSDNPNIGKMMSMARAGDRVFIDDIKAVGPDGQVRTLNAINLLLN